MRSLLWYLMVLVFGDDNILKNQHILKYQNDLSVRLVACNYQTKQVNGRTYIKWTCPWQE